MNSLNIGLIRNIGSRNFIRILLSFSVFQKTNKDFDFEVKFYGYKYNNIVVSSFGKYFLQDIRKILEQVLMEVYYLKIKAKS
jgi:hypothetical protein